MSDETMNETTTEEVVTESAPEESGADNAAEGKAKESTDADGGKDKGDEEGKDDGGEEVGYSVDDFTMPEGFEVDETAMGEFLEIANNREMTDKERNQALINLYAKRSQEAVESQLQQWDDTRKDWQSKVKADKELGGKALDENLALAQKAMAHFGSKELQEFGESYGWADHPEYIRMLVRIGKTLSEDTLAQGKSDSQTPIESRWYGSNGKN